MGHKVSTMAYIITCASTTVAFTSYSHSGTAGTGILLPPSIGGSSIASTTTAKTTALHGLPRKLMKPIQSSKLRSFLRRGRENKTQLTNASSSTMPYTYNNDSFITMNNLLYDQRLMMDETRRSYSEEYRRGMLKLREALATDVRTLRDQFGENRNKLWGDLDNETARRLYHTLLPRVLLRVTSNSEIREDELAHLAYQARLAAKQYARERCNVPGRMFAMAFDGFRHWKAYGNWSTKGMTWDEVWEKYEREVISNMKASREQQSLTASHLSDVNEEDLTKRICLRILERSCKTNPTIDQMFLKSSEGEENSSDDVVLVAQQIDKEIHDLIENSLAKTNFGDVNTLNIQWKNQIDVQYGARVAVVMTRKNLRKIIKRDMQMRMKELSFNSNCSPSGANISEARSPKNRDSSKLARFAKYQQRRARLWEDRTRRMWRSV